MTKDYSDLVKQSRNDLLYELRDKKRRWHVLYGHTKRQRHLSLTKTSLFYLEGCWFLVQCAQLNKRIQKSLVGGDNLQPQVEILWDQLETLTDRLENLYEKYYPGVI